MWNTVYSLLSRLSGSMMFDLFERKCITVDHERLIGSYVAETARSIAFSRGGCRTSNAGAGWAIESQTLRLRPKGLVMAVGNTHSLGAPFRWGWAGA